MPLDLVTSKKNPTCLLSTRRCQRRSGKPLTTSRCVSTDRLLAPTATDTDEGMARIADRRAFLSSAILALE